MKKNNVIKRAIEKEDMVIGNLKNQFLRPTIQAQRQVSVSPAETNGNIALGYYRGMAAQRQDTEKRVLRLLNKKFPEAVKYLKSIDGFGKYRP